MADALPKDVLFLYGRVAMLEVSPNCFCSFHILFRIPVKLRCFKCRIFRISLLLNRLLYCIIISCLEYLSANMFLIRI